MPWQRPSTSSAARRPPLLAEMMHQSCGMQPPTIREALARARAKLSSRTSEALLEAEVLLAHVLGQTRAYLYTHPERRLTYTEWRAYEEILHQRVAGQPVAYLLRHREFYGLDFIVDPRVLIPRPETELLVERVLVLTQKDPPAAARWLLADVGTGSGAIAISIAVHRPRALIYAIDLWAAALDVAALNAQRHGVSERVVLLHGDLLEPLPKPVHLVLANLPYLGDKSWAALPEEIAQHEPRSALYGGPEGLDLYRRLLLQAPGHLLPHGHLLLEIDPQQALPLKALAAQVFGPPVKTFTWPDLAGHDRVLEIEVP